MQQSRRFLNLVLPLFLATSLMPYLAHAEDKKAAAAPSVQLASVAVPVTRDNRLVNYLFLSIKVNLTLKANEAKLREMEPYFRDIIVREASKTSFGRADDDEVLDEAHFKAVMIPAFEQFAGRGTIKSIDILAQNPKFHHKY
jgi:hypothetical protein